MIKQITSISFTLLLSLMLVACGSGSAIMPSTRNTSNSPMSNTTVAEAEEPEEVKPDVGDIIEFGGYQWRVLEVREDSALLLSEYIVEMRAYHDVYEYVTWKDCTLRGYLNEDFFSKFSAVEQKRIKETSVVSASNPWYKSVDGGEDTVDNIFLLSLDEVVQYFGDSGDFSNDNNHGGTTFSDNYNSERSINGAKKKNKWMWWQKNEWMWWLRSPGFASYTASYVFTDGEIYVYGGDVYFDTGGVRPALWIDLNQ